VCNAVNIYVLIFTLAVIVYVVIFLFVCLCLRLITLQLDGQFACNLLRMSCHLRKICSQTYKSSLQMVYEQLGSSNIGALTCRVVKELMVDLPKLYSVY
jgi:hypothetical protein